MVMSLLQNTVVIEDRVPALSARRAAVRPVTTRRWFQVVGLWIERSRQRRALMHLDDWLLDDIGITRSEAAREIAKPFWR
jgi:uncharacterized protein YjiS (DUF1127 family)